MPRLQYNLSDIPDFVSIKPGRYFAKLRSCVKANSRAGKPQLVWTWQLMSGPQKGQTIKSWTSLQEHALSGLKQHLIAMGAKPKSRVDVDSDRLIGTTVVIIVAMRKGPGRDGQETDYATITAMLPKSAGIATRASTNDFDEDEEDEEDDEEEDEEEDENEEEDEDDEDDDEEEEDEIPVARRNGKSRPVKSTKRTVKAAASSRRSRRRSDDDDDDTPF